MRIGIDGGSLANRRGFGRFARRLLMALAEQPTHHRFVVLADEPSRAELAIPERFETRWVPVRVAPSRAAHARGRRSLSDLLTMSHAARRSRLDALFFPTSYTYFPAWGCGRQVVVVHDTLPLDHPELVFPTWAGRVAWTVKERLAVANADLVVTVSEASRRDIVRGHGLDRSRIAVIPEGSDPIFQPIDDGGDALRLTQRLDLKPGCRYLLYVGGLSPHKNLVRLVEGFARGAPADLVLVLVGDHQDGFHTELPAIRQAIKQASLGERVRLPGFVEDATLAGLYRQAAAVIQPSLHEGFGLPVLEAMACGTPVICSRAGSLPEVVGEAGLYFDPTSVAEIADAIARFFHDPKTRERLAGVALQRASWFTWERAAQRLLQIFDELEQGGPSPADWSIGRREPRSVTQPAPTSPPARL